MRHGKAAAGEIGIERLDVAQARSAGGGIAHVARRHVSGQFGDGFGGGEVLGDMAKTAPDEEFLAVPADDSRSFLPAMLERMEAQRGRRGGIRGVDRTEDSALLAQAVAISIEEGVSHIEGCHRHHQTCPQSCRGVGTAPMAM